MTLSASDAALHATQNPYLHPFLGDANLRVTMILLVLLAAVFLKGFTEAIETGDGGLHSVPASERGGAGAGIFRGGHASGRLAALAGRADGTGRLEATGSGGGNFIPAAGARVERLRNRRLGDAADSPAHRRIEGGSARTDGFETRANCWRPPR